MKYPPYENCDVRVEVDEEHVLMQVMDPKTWGWVTARLTVKQAYELGHELAIAGLWVTNNPGETK